MMTRRNTPPLNAFVLFLLFSVSGLLLSLSPVEAIGLSIFWTLFGFLLARTSWISGNSPSGLESNKGLLLIVLSYLGALIATVLMIYSFDYLSPTTTDNLPVPISESPTMIFSLISFWTIAISSLLAHFLRSYSETLKASAIIQQKRSSDTLSSTPLSPQLNHCHSIVVASGAKKRWVIPDISTLEDGRAFDIAKLGLFDGFYALPSFVIRELKAQSVREDGDESARFRVKKALDTIRRMETLPKLAFEIIDEANPEENHPLLEKLYKFAHSTHSSLLTLDPSHYRFEGEEGDSHCVISLDAIASAVRQPIPKGDYLSIKIQRLGKEPKQGIGYLDDGTMVVVNGGGDYLGKTIRTQVLSQKYSSSGKIIFCNALSLTDEEASTSYSGSSLASSSIEA